MAINRKDRLVSVRLLIFAAQLVIMRLLLTFCTFLFFKVIFINAQPAVFERITIENGLSQGMIFDVLQTRDGFLWVATKDGLNRYDGYNFKVFSHDPFDPFSVAENTVTALFEDSRGWLWVGTQSKGVDMYDRRSGRFHHFSLNFKSQGKGSVFDVFSIREAPDGSIYLLQFTNELTRIQIPENWQHNLPAEPDLGVLATVTQFPVDRFRMPEDKNPDMLRAIEMRDNGDIWLYSTVRPYLLEPDKGMVTPIVEKSPLNVSQNSDYWVALNSDLVRFQNGVPRLFALPKTPIAPWIITKPAANKHFWVAIDNRLWLLAPGELPDLAKPDWVLDERIPSIETDRNGNIWVGTLGYGLRKINPKKQAFHTGAVRTSIWGLWRDVQGRYFCKVVNELFAYDPISGEISTEQAFPETSTRILDMCMDSSGHIWMLGRGEEENGRAELWHQAPGSHSFRPYSFDFSPYVYARLLQSRAGKIWITGLNGQLVRFDPLTTRFDYFSYAALFGEKANTVRAFALAEDGNGNLWVGTQQGLVKCTPNGNAFDYQLMQADSKNAKGLNNNSIACLLPDPAHPAEVLWVGTKGGGINRLDIRSGQFQHLTMEDGLPDKVIYGILPGNENPATTPVSLWCSTNRGLVKLTPNINTSFSFDITTFTATKGLQDNEFNTQAFFKAANHELLFGGVNGLNHFFPEDLRSDTTPPPVFVVGAEINHQPVSYSQPNSPLTVPVEYLRELHLSYDQNNLSFEFAALDFTDPTQNRYRYRLVGLDADWIETGGTRFAHFTHLAPGKYEFRVQGSNGEGVWREAGHPIVVIVHPPWYRSNLAYLLYFLGLVGAGWRIYRFQVRRLQEREQLAYEHRETERVKAMEQTKTNFFSNITHEFRTPLTLIIEPARRILAKSQDPDITENARHVETNSRRLLALVNQLLDMAKLESGSMGIDLRQGDLEEIVQTIFHSFQPLAEQRGIQFALNVPDLPLIMFDPAKVELVLNNLISNALKFTPTGGKVTISCEQLTTSGAKQIQIIVRDTGIGIPAAALDKVFDRFYQVDSSHTRAGEGTGIGLALSKELAELMGGSLTVKSTPGEGSVFTFSLPMIASAGEWTATASPMEETLTTVILKNPAPRSAAEMPCVLLIEDNAELRAFVKKCIAHEWQVIEASNGAEGVEKALKALPDLVISDLMMPLKDGYTVCNELKNNELTSHIPIILLTAKSTIDAKIKGLRTGADDYLTKPFNSEELLARMENLLETRRRLRAHYSQAGLPDTPPKMDYLTTLDQEFLRRFTLTVEQHLPDEKIGVEDLAQKMFVSRVQLHRKLKAITDQNVTDFVRDYRLNRAMLMLKNHEGMVYEVASKVGFGSEKYFSRAFKEKFGVPPSQIN